MAKSSTTHKTNASSRNKSKRTSVVAAASSEHTIEKQRTTVSHPVKHSHATSAKPAAKEIRQHQQPTAKTDGFVIHRQKKQHANAKVWRGWILVLLAVAGIAVICAMVASRLLQHGDKTTSSSDSTISSSASKPEVIESLPSKPTALSKAEERTASIGSSLEQTNFSSSTVVKLNVPLHKQTYGQSCEASALRMALEYRGIKTTDMAILEQMGYDGVVAKTINGKTIWTDPHKQYVGDRDGDQQKLTGYGVFAEPTAAASEKNGRAAEVKNDVQTDWIVRQLYAGNPVILWGVSVKISDTVWYTEAGETVNAPLRTHTRLVIGFKGDPNNPAGFYLNDPATGTEKYWTTAALKTDISKGIKQAVAVY